MCGLCSKLVSAVNLIECTRYVRLERTYYEICVDCLCKGDVYEKYYLIPDEVTRLFLGLKTKFQGLQDKLEALENEIKLMPGGDLMLKSAEEFASRVAEIKVAEKEKKAQAEESKVAEG